ncbi:hypothetical protein D9619_001921 [Psilocybe cf. subviscida]|uniref:Non-structural maintenance of chromosomes element 4 n=1 Tax=Psilocybe cf. subviscida TaxID=2480587 RepID=A0A8H5BGY7_9AGAR|nr:hypothetical protein D9619_001921 [Psilocybe cf. subviscida]
MHNHERVIDDEEMVFDPDQDPEEKRAVRQGYRALTKKIEEYRSNPKDLQASELLAGVQRVDGLFGKVKGPQEATLDSNYLLMASSIGVQKARAMKSGSGAFDVDDFITKLARYMGGRRNIEDALPEESDDGEETQDGRPLDWDRIGLKALAKSRRVPALTFMLGPLSIEQKKRTVTKRARLEKNKEDERRPLELKEEELNQAENETTKNVRILSTLLEYTGPINLFKFIINPKDFAQSVENMFYLSFIIRDGNAALSIEDGEYMIMACQPPSDEDYEGGLKRQQLVFELDMATWRRAIEVFNITEPIIKKDDKDKEKKKDPNVKWY